MSYLQFLPGSSRAKIRQRGMFVNGHTMVIAIVMCIIMALYFIPIVRMVAAGIYDSGTGLSLGPLNTVLGNDFYRNVVLNTVRISAIVTALCVLLAYPVSYMMAVARGRRLQIILFCVMLPLWMSVVVKTYAWLIILQKKGVVNAILDMSGLVEQPLSLVFGDFAVIIGSVHMMLPFMILPVYASLRRIDPSLYKAAMSLGATPSRAFLHVILPLSLPGVAAGGLIIFVLELGFFVTPAVLGGGRVLMIAPIIQKQLDSFSNWGVVAILSTILLAIAVVAVIISEKLIGKARATR